MPVFTEPWSILVAAIIGLVSGVAVAIISGLINHVNSQRKRADDLFATALEFMGGGRQRRNLGISALTLLWREFPERKQLCAEMLIGSAIYMLTESKGEDAAHEIFNLRRVMDLLKDISPDIMDRKGYVALENIVTKRVNENQTKPNRGLWVEKADLEGWRTFPLVR